ncbi:uncharacterized protein ELE39_001851 [Cryptosporidium sp. chipmunk genotype I]|uniref:uncharacterized protein n=1 Tax=Cryptosporidium sp. chipmunk genotype I TaxID=1280935 RepID=UPI003519E7D3|nr:hypothetical protein ELE39_001851 [Cryptosporidium sp. chipmunk genotype I]
MHAKLKSSQIWLTTLLIIAIICEIECTVNFLGFFENFVEDLRQDILITDQCTSRKEEKLKCYWIILENELIHLLRAAKSDNNGILGFNRSTKTIIFLRKLIDLIKKNSKSKTRERFIAYQGHPYLNNSIIDGYEIKWYNHYELDDIERTVDQLSKINLGDYGIMNFRNQSSKFEKNSKNLTIKLVILSIFYRQYSIDQLAYRKITENKNTINNYIQYLSKFSNREIALLKKDIESLIKNSEVTMGNKKNSLKRKFKFTLENIQSELTSCIEKASNSFDNIRKKLYSRILEYYLLVIILVKLFFIFSRKLLSMILLLNHILIYILDNFEDYLFMLISLQFTFEMVFTLIQEAMPQILVISG